MKLDWQALQDLSENNTPKFVSLSAMSVTLIEACYSFLIPEHFWLLNPDDPAQNFTERDEIKAAIAHLMRELRQDMLIGSVMPFLVFPPGGTLVCDGAAYSRVDYPLLYEYLLPTALILDADTFATPTIRDRFVLASGDTYGQFTIGGAATHTLTESEMPIHDHIYTPAVLNVDLESPGAPDIFAAGVGLPTTTSSTGGGAAHNNMPPFVALPYCIVAG